MPLLSPSPLLAAQKSLQARSGTRDQLETYDHTERRLVSRELLAVGSGGRSCPTEAPPAALFDVLAVVILLDNQSCQKSSTLKEKQSSSRQQSCHCSKPTDSTQVSTQTIVVRPPTGRTSFAANIVVGLWSMTGLASGLVEHWTILPLFPHRSPLSPRRVFTSCNCCQIALKT